MTIPASEVYADNGVLFITPSATNPKVTDRGLWDAFRTCGRDDQQGKLWADLALGELKDKKIAIVHDKTPYGQGLADAAKGFMNAGGKKEVLYEGVNVGEKDYSAIVSKIKAAGADYVMWGGLHTEGGLIVRQMRDQGMKTIMISGDGITDTEFASIGGPGVEGTLMSFGPEPRNNPNAKDGVAAFKAKGFEPQGYTLYSYAAIQIIKQAAKRPIRSIRRRSPTSCIRAWPFKTVHRRHLLRQEGRPHHGRLRLVRLEEGRRRQDRVRADVRRAPSSGRSRPPPGLRPGAGLLRLRERARVRASAAPTAPCAGPARRAARNRSARRLRRRA